MNFGYSCHGTCHCGGCSADGFYGYEGYRRPANGGWCGCSYHDDEQEHHTEEPDVGPYAARISVSFTEPAVIFEDRYENKPGSSVQKQSTETVLNCVVHGGPNGGTATFTFTGRDKLEGGTLPQSVQVPAGYRSEHEITYRGRLPSGGKEDIVVYGTFQENAPDATPLDSEAKLTSVKVEMEAVYVAPENACQSRHIYGVGEKVRFKITPTLSNLNLEVDKADACDHVTLYDTFEGALSIQGPSVATYTCPAAGTTPDITVGCAGVQYAPSLSVIEPHDSFVQGGKNV